jgi:DNA polymerase-3 subunit epsilon
VPISFAAIDVETANADLASICQIGIVIFADGKVVDHLQSLIDPEDEFDAINVSIHGIDDTAVRGAPRFCDIASTVAKMIGDRIVASHMAFDRVALSRVHEKYRLAQIPCRWIDTARVCRRAWKQFSQRGYGLADVAAHCGITFRHHQAVEDARVAGEVLLRAISETGISLEEWLGRSNQPVDPQGSRTTRSGNPDGALFGEVVVFTGALLMPRREAADLAASAGCAVVGSVGQTVTLLVVGDQDVRRLAGHQKSSKHRKAEELIGKGQAIRILTERDFSAMIGLDAQSLR